MGQRIDKWLVYARFVKHRSDANRLIEEGRVRINREKVAKLSQTVRIGDVLTLAVGAQVKVVRVMSELERRESASAASRSYEALALPV